MTPDRFGPRWRFSTLLTSWAYYERGDWWLRIGRRGWGLSRMRLAGHTPLWSEREGIYKAWHTRRSCWKRLNPYTLKGQR